MPTIRTITALGILAMLAGYTQSEQTIICSSFAKESSAHSGQSAFRMLSVGADGFALRTIEYTTKPSGSLRRRMQADTLSLLPIENEL